MTVVQLIPAPPGLRAVVVDITEGRATVQAATALVLLEEYHDSGPERSIEVVVVIEGQLIWPSACDHELDDMFVGRVIPPGEPDPDADELVEFVEWHRFLIRHRRGPDA